MYATINSGLLAGLDLIPIRTEVSISAGLPSFTIVGLPTNAVSESRTRVKAALKQQGCNFPNRRVVVNLAPADIRKDTALFDLPIALAILAAQRPDFCNILKNVMCFGELSLGGQLSSSHLSLPLTLAAKQAGYQEVFVNAADAPCAAIIPGITVRGFNSIAEIVAHLTGESVQPQSQPEQLSSTSPSELDFNQIHGLKSAKRAMLIAAIGAHNVRLSGPPGCGKSMLGARLHTILPDLSPEHALELSAMERQRVNGHRTFALTVQAPSRCPHYSISTAGLVGGGANPKPGEVSLAHHGVLFLDEFLEFRRPQLEALRTPIEEQYIQLSRCEHIVTYPTKCMLVAAHNPCPCGYYGNTKIPCRCTISELRGYQSKLSGPLNDRFDLHVKMEASGGLELPNAPLGMDSSQDLKAMVKSAREFGASDTVRQNRKISPKAIKQLARISNSGHYSFRRRARLINVSKSIANLAQSITITEAHIEEAYYYSPIPCTQQRLNTWSLKQ